MRLQASSGIVLSYFWYFYKHKLLINYVIWLVGYIHVHNIWKSTLMMLLVLVSMDKLFNCIQENTLILWKLMNFDQTSCLI